MVTLGRVCGRLIYGVDQYDSGLRSKQSGRRTVCISALPAVMVSVCVLLLVLVPSTRAGADPFGVESFDGTVTADPASCSVPAPCSYAQAGGHPAEVSLSMRFNTDPDPLNGPLWPSEPVKDIVVDFPPGLSGNPTVVAHCTMDELVGRAETNFVPECPAASQVGVVSLSASAGPEAPIPLELVLGPLLTNQPLFSMVPPPGVPARFAFNILGSVITMDVRVRSGTDYGLSVKVQDVSEALPALGADVTLWGVPADPSHTPLRHCPGGNFGTGGCEAGVPPRAFLTLPTSCSGPQETTVRIDSWFRPGVFESASFLSHKTVTEGGGLLGVTACESVPFTPDFTAKPDTAISPGPSGWTFDLSVPQETIDDAHAIAQSHLKAASIVLPAGVRVSPAAADGLAACAAAEVDLHGASDVLCPAASRVGVVSIDTPLLDEVVRGAVFLAKPHDNPADSLLGLYLVAKGPGVIIKLFGAVARNPNTGGLVTTFENEPQLPFSRIRLHLVGGPRAVLSNPPRCGTYITRATLSSWSGKTVEAESEFSTSRDGAGAPCPPLQFKPEFHAGTETDSGRVPSGGSYSSFGLAFSRTDDDEEFAAIKSVDMPDGLLAKIAGVPLCAAVKVAAGTCGEESRVGSVTTAAGPGPNPFTIDTGRVYLGGPYKGAPFSLLIVVPAVAGPFDLGTVVVRAAVSIDPATAKLKVASDPLPTVLQGIPLQVRLVTVTIDRPSFIVNPTSCNPKRIGATVQSVAGKIANLSSHFQADNCARLALSPKLTFTVGAKGRTRNGTSTPLKTTLTQPPGQAGLKSVNVVLPDTLNARLGVVNQACSQAEFDAGHCGNDARVGSAVAVTPLLDEPLKGSAFFVKNPARAIPDLVVALRGQVAFNLVGKVKIPGGKVLSTHFSGVPDVPIKRFTLSLVAGKNGPVGTAANLCTARSKRQVARIGFRGQNGKLFQVNQRLRVRGCAARR
jgi:hypothetical protein